jgi:hypothetical protein
MNLPGVINLLSIISCFLLLGFSNDINPAAVSTLSHGLFRIEPFLS